MKFIALRTLLIIQFFSMTALAKESLVCQSSDGYSVTGILEGAAMVNAQLSLDGKILSSENYLSAVDSYDMYKSEKFKTDLPYSGYSLAHIDGCNFYLKLPGGDLRNYTFVALLSTWGSCNTSEVELNCKTKTVK